jgi:hypothetical protein
MTTKNDCLESLSLNLAKTGPWRGLQSKKWPDDTRNGPAAQRLADLAEQATDISDHQWALLAPHFDPADRRWNDAVSTASRDVGFRSKPATFDAYVETVLAALVAA